MYKVLVWVSLLMIILATGCSDSGMAVSSTPQVSQSVSPLQSHALPTPITATHSLTVFAAASLTGAFQEIGKEFEAADPGTQVNFNFAASQILRTQLEQGAPADVFASADHKNMNWLIAEQLVAENEVQDFATNSLIVIVPPGNPGKVMRLSDLTKPRLKLVLVDASVPAGDYARQVLTKISQDPEYGADFSSRVLANVVSNETDVKQVVTKVELGEADAGIVYVSDAVAAPELITISIPAKFNVVATYPIAKLANAPEPMFAEAFIAYVASQDGQAILVKWGFGTAAH